MLVEHDLVCVHIDRKSSSSNIPPFFKNHPNFILCEPRIKVYHGDFSIIEAYMQAYELCRPLLTGVDYINVLSGQDYPVRELSDFRTFLEENKGRSYINIVPVPVTDNTYHNGSMNQPFMSTVNWPGKKPIYFFDRMNSFNYIWSGNKLDVLQYRSYPFEKNRTLYSIIRWVKKYRTFNRLNNQLRGWRPIPEFPVYGGSAWITVTYDVMEFFRASLLDSKNKKIISYLRRLKYADEFTIQTLLMNLRYPRMDMIINSDLRYINWTKADFYGHPAFVREEDISLISQSNAFFCRKADKTSIDLINQHLLNRPT
ncbi:MAG: hypothetical protein H6608_11770 [Flavobacteriales bacterium]|nr:hypothetical protein [Bacteroidota bacterium]MCB9241806.1 hypothetical protein [Flavobacteriales bacterium]